VTDIIKIGRDGGIHFHECNRGYYLLNHYYVFGNPAKMFTLRKKMYLEVKRTSRK